MLKISSKKQDRELNSFSFHYALFDQRLFILKITKKSY
tara:strand:+ start:671 stop:784 length:114 start_codon:yes stop_codon:yes gene_type:complete